MSDIFSRMREEAEKKAQKRNENDNKKQTTNGDDETRISAEVAEFLGISKEEVEDCCGNTCPHCDIFLSKAIALEELGYEHHLFLNPTQQEMFKDALAIYRRDIKEYERKEQELMDEMR